MRLPRDARQLGEMILALGHAPVTVEHWSHVTKNALPGLLVGDGETGLRFMNDGELWNFERIATGNGGVVEDEIDLEQVLAEWSGEID